MKRLDRFLIKSFIWPFIMTFCIVLFVLAMQFLWVYIDELVGKGLGLSVILEFLGWAAATMIPMALPLATLLASIMTLGGLGEKNELLAMKAAGIPLSRIMLPLIVISGGITIGAFFASNDLIPIAWNKIYTLRDDIGRTKEEINIPVGTFYDGIDGYILRMEGKNPDTDMMYHLSIYDHTQYKGNVNVTLADSGAMRITPDKSKLIFDLYHGCSYQEENQMTYRDTVLDLRRLHFEKQTLMISLDNYEFSRSEDDRFGDEVMCKSLSELKVDRDSLSTEYDSLYIKQFNRYISSAGLYYHYQLDSTRNEKIVGQFDLDSLYALTEKNGGEVDAVRRAMDNIQTPTDLIENYVREDYGYVDHVRRIDIESFRKFTLSLACLIFFFIGAPLGALIRKGGLGTPSIISILFFLVYYIIDISGKKLARDGALSPFAGTFIASAVLLPIGIFLTWKSTKDSSLFNVDSYKEFFKTLWKNMVGIYRKGVNLFRKGGGRVRIVYMGTPEFAVAPLAKLLENGYDIAAVVTVPDKQSGRGLKVSESAVKKFAVEKGLKVLQPVSLKSPEFLEELQGLKANLFIVVAFRMLPKVVWAMPELGTFNLHASLLPQYRGAAPINWAIINGEIVTGVTTFMLDEQIDTGNIIYQERCEIKSYDNAGTLHDKLQALGSDLVLKSVEGIKNRTVKLVKQEDYDSLKLAPKLTKESCRIDWSRDASEIERLIQGLSPYPAAFSNLVLGETHSSVKIFDAYVCEKSNPEAAPGSITSDGKSYLEVACGEGAIKITSLQMAGKRRLEIKDFLLGFRDAESYKFV